MFLCFSLTEKYAPTITEQLYLYSRALNVSERFKIEIMDHKRFVIEETEINIKVRKTTEKRSTVVIDCYNL